MRGLLGDQVLYLRKEDILGVLDAASLISSSPSGKGDGSHFSGDLDRTLSTSLSSRLLL